MYAPLKQCIASFCCFQTLQNQITLSIFSCDFLKSTFVKCNHCVLYAIVHIHYSFMVTSAGNFLCIGLLIITEHFLYSTYRGADLLGSQNILALNFITVYSSCINPHSHQHQSTIPIAPRTLQYSDLDLYFHDIRYHKNTHCLPCKCQLYRQQMRSGYIQTSSTRLK